MRKNARLLGKNLQEYTPFEPLFQINIVFNLGNIGNSVAGGLMLDSRCKCSASLLFLRRGVTNLPENCRNLIEILLLWDLKRAGVFQ